MAITNNEEVTEAPAQPPVAPPGLVAPILFGLLGAWWASNKASKLGVLNTKRYWIAAAISTGVVALATVLVPILMLLAVSASVGSGAVLNNPSAVSPLGNAADSPAVQSNPANPNTSATMYGLPPAKDDLAGPAGAVVWSVKDRAYCHVLSDQVPCLSQLYSTRGPAYDFEVSLANGSGYPPDNWGATDIVITAQSADHFTADFTVTASQASDTRTPARGSFTWSPSLGVWQVDEFSSRP